MGFSCGIVGLPNVGKSALFNALTATAAAEVTNFPFSTVEPNLGRVGVPDPRLDLLVEIDKPAKITPTHLEFVDIAGIAAGAGKGEGLGNRFLGNIRDVDAIIHVLKCYGDEMDPQGELLDPVGDSETVELELMLADLESLERRAIPLSKKARVGEREAKERLDLIERVLALLREGQPARALTITEDEKKAFKMLQLLTAKPVLYVCNVSEEAAATGNDASEKVMAMAAETGAEAVVISARIEEELAQLDDGEEKAELLESLGLKTTGLGQVIRAGYGLLDLITFFTAGDKECRAWTVRKGASAPQAAGVIHSDFERGFIRAETIAYDDYVTLRGEQPAKDAGKMRLEGKNYVVRDADVMHFRFNV